MTEPTTKEEYEARFAEHELITGYGLETSVHMPCPFCASRDWAVYRVVDSQEALLDEHVCKECKRGAKMIFVTNEPNVKEFRFVQTCGSEPPEWCLPMERVG